MKNLTKNTKILYGFISVYFIMYALFKIGIVIFYFKGYSPQEYQLYFVNYFKIPTNWEDFKMYPTGILLSLIAIEYYIQLIIFILGFVIFYKILKTHVNLNLILKSIFITGIIINFSIFILEFLGWGFEYFLNPTYYLIQYMAILAVVIKGRTALFEYIMPEINLGVLILLFMGYFFYTNHQFNVANMIIVCLQLVSAVFVFYTNKNSVKPELV